MDSTVIRDTKVGVLDKAMRILQVFPGGDVALTPQQIARSTGMPLPTVYRLAHVLSEHGWLMKEGQQFRLGMTLLRLGAMVAEGIDVRSRSLPHLRWLKEQTSENSELYIRSNESRVALEVVRSPHNLGAFVEIGAPLPLHVGAGGKVLLAWLPDQEQSDLIAASVALYSNYPLSDMQALKSVLAQIRDKGWAMSEGERASDVGAIAAPIFDVSKQIVGAMVLAVPIVRLGEKERAAYVPLVCDAARRASLDMGYLAQEKHAI
ncbi:MAG TPA: IclR family transcriptional regulator [Ktedonobacteraceae bacterium]|nr:IclR family transcriptional regulator [Ktedonobacteraceae bacterium]